MKNLLKMISVLFLIVSALNNSLTAQPQYYNFNSAGTSNAFPFNISTGKMIQTLHLPGEFSNPAPAPSGQITSVFVQLFTAMTNKPFTDLTIKMGQTTLTDLTANTFYSGPMTTVYYRSSITINHPADWLEFILDTPFPYDPTQSLVIEIGQCQSAMNTGGNVRYTITSGIKRIASFGGCPYTPSVSATAYITHTGINVAPAGGPPIVVTTAATGVTAATATLNGTVNANNASTTVSFEYGLTTAYGSTVAGVPATVNGTAVTPVSAAIAGLLPGTTYHFRAKGVNSFGTTNGNDMTFTTPAPPPTVITLAATSVTATGATLNGSVNANGPATAVTFQYGLTTAYGSTAAGVPPTATGTSVTPESAVITGLLPNTLYHFRIVGTVGAVITNGADLTFTTGPEALTVVTNLASNITTSGAQLNGTVTANSTLATVSFEWGLTTAYGNTVAGIPPTVSGNTATASLATLTGLLTNTMYHYRCVGVNTFGTVYGLDQSFLTGCPAPAPAGPITGSTTVCAGSTGNVYTVGTIVNAVSYAWTLPAGAVITAGTGTNIITVTFGTTAGNITVAGVNTCGNGTSSSYAVIVNALPTPTITGPASLCANTSGHVYTTQAGMTGYAWTVSAGGTITAGAGTNAITVTWSTSGTKTVNVNYANAAGCTATTPASFNVTVNPVPVPTIGSTNNPCVGSTGNVYYTESGMTNYAWTVSAGGTIVSGQGTSSINVTWNGVGAQTVGVTYTNSFNCNPATPTVQTVFVNPVPGAAGTITGVGSVCAGTNGVAYSCAPIPNAVTYTWNLPAGATIATGAGSSNITVNFGATAVSGNITVSGTNSCGNGAPSPAFPVTVNPLPAAAGVITGAASVCAGQTNVAYSVATITGAATYNWTVPAGATIVSGATTRNIMVNFGPNPASGVITVKGVNACGEGPASPNFNVTINAIPATPVVTANGPVLTSSASTGNQWYYEGNAIPGATGQSYTITNNTGYYWCVVTVNGCSSGISNKVWIEITGIGELPGVSFNVYPVPNDGKFTVTLAGASPDTFTIQVFNQIGSRIYELKDVQVNGTFEKEIDLRPIATGVYSVVFLNSDHKVVRKVLVNK